MTGRRLVVCIWVLTIYKNFVQLETLYFLRRMPNWEFTSFCQFASSPSYSYWSHILLLFLCTVGSVEAPHSPYSTCDLKENQMAFHREVFEDSLGHLWDGDSYEIPGDNQEVVATQSAIDGIQSATHSHYSNIHHSHGDHHDNPMQNQSDDTVNRRTSSQIPPLRQTQRM